MIQDPRRYVVVRVAVWIADAREVGEGEDRRVAFGQPRQKMIECRVPLEAGEELANRVATAKILESP